MPFLICCQDPNVRQKKTGQLIEQLGDQHELLVTTQSGIDDVREWLGWIKIAPGVNKKKVLVIGDSQNLSVEAQNALLKTLEEPPDNVSIILQSFDEDLLLPTIVSRCVVLRSNKNLVLSDELVQQQISDLTSGKVFALDLASTIKDRQTALEWLDQSALVLRQKLSIDRANIKRLESFFQAKKMLLGNTNVRLTLENLFLNW